MNAVTSGTLNAARGTFAAFLLIAVLGRTLEAQRKPAPQPAPPAELSAEAAAAYEELSPRFAGEGGLIQGWYRDRTVMYYDFGNVPLNVVPGRVLWPIHGFDMRGNPVAIRGQRPIFSTIPGLADYSGVFHLVYVVVSDNAQANFLRDEQAVAAMVNGKKAWMRETQQLFNLPIVPRGGRLARDSTSGLAGWYQGRDVQFFDFGSVTTTPVAMWRFATGRDAAGAPIVHETQNSIVDSIPVSGTYPDLWEIRFAFVDSAYVPNSLKNATALRNAPVVIDTARTIRNLPITIIDGSPVQRAPSPLRLFADLRSPFPPAFTRPQQ